MTNDEMAQQLRESVMAGYYLVPWDELQDCEKVKWQRGAATMRLLLRGAETQRQSRTVAIPSAPDPHATMTRPKPLRERVAERLAG